MKRGAVHDEVEESEGGCDVSKKLCLDGAAAGVTPQLAKNFPVEPCVELVWLILWASYYTTLLARR